MHDRHFPYRRKRHFIYGQDFEIERPLGDGLLAIDRATHSEKAAKTIAAFSKKVGFDEGLFRMLIVAME